MTLLKKLEVKVPNLGIKERLKNVKKLILKKLKWKKEENSKEEKIWIVVKINGEYNPKSSERIIKRLQHEGQEIEIL